MVDPLAVVVAGLIAKKAAEAVGDEAGRGAWEVVGRLAAAVRRRFVDDRGAEQVLTAVEMRPSDKSVVALAAAVERHVHDQAFRGELEDLVAEAAAREPGVGQFVTNVSGGHVGKIVNIGRTRDVSF